MSIMSSYRPDNSSARYRRFAQLAYSCANEPKIAKKTDNQIPLESLFRLLEMYRFDAYKDEVYSGVLDLRSSKENSHHPLAKSWHESIKVALDKAIQISFEGKSKEEAVKELETILYLMSNKKTLTTAQQTEAKVFFGSFSQALS